MVIRKKKRKKEGSFQNKKLCFFHGVGFHRFPFLMEKSVCILDNGCRDVTPCFLHSTFFCWLLSCMHFSLAYACEKSVCILDLCFSVRSIMLISIFFFHSSWFFFLHAFFPKHMHTKQARRTFPRFFRCAAPRGRRQKIKFKKMRGGFSTKCFFFDPLRLPTAADIRPT